MNISAIIPLYNGQEFIERAVRSVFNQTKLPSELIIVDDASTDKSVAIVEAMLPNAPISVKILKLEKNSGGPAKPLNMGIRAARGELISILDQDDYWFPQKTECFATILESDSDIRMVFCDFDYPAHYLRSEREMIKEQIIATGKSSETFAEVIKLSPSVSVPLFLRHSNPAFSFSGMLFYRTDAFKKGGFNEYLMICADYDFNCWLVLESEIAYISKKLYFKGIHKKNLSCHPECKFEEANIFLKYFWKAIALGIVLDDLKLREKLLERIVYYGACCQRKKRFRAGIVNSLKAIKHLGASQVILLLLIKLWIRWMADRFSRFFYVSHGHG